MNFREEAKRLEEEQRRVGAEQAMLASAFRSVAATPDGKRVLRWIVEEGKLFSDEFSPNASHAYNSGVKSIPRRVWLKLRDHAERGDFITICMGGNGNV